jgi:hypothetical protein
VPKSLDDLIDYMHPQDVVDINGTFCVANRLVERVGEEYAFRTKPLPELMASTDSETIQLAGMLVMTEQNESGGHTDSNMPERQNMLRRAAEFYLLHLYHYPVASLLLAKYINPLTFCHCSNTNCEGRAFGFADAHGMVRLVLRNMGYIEEMFDRDEKEMVTEKTITISDIRGEYIGLIMDTAEVLMTIDQNREHSPEVRDLLEFVADCQEMVPPIEYCRALTLASVAWDLYDDENPVPKLFFKEVSGQSEDLKRLSVLAFDQFLSTVKERPMDKYLPLFDAHNFFAHGNNWVSPGYGMILRSRFLMSLFDSDYVEEFLAEAGTIPDDPDAPEGLREIVVGYQKNLMSVLARRGFSLPEVLPGAAAFATDPSVTRYLADIAWAPSIQRYQQGSNLSSSAKDFWRQRMEMAQHFVDI